MSRWIRLAAVIALLGAGPARAAEGPVAAGAPVVLYGPDGPDEAAEQRAHATFNLFGEDRRAAPSVRHVTTALGFIDDVELVGDGEIRGCPGAPVGLAPFAAGLDEALDHLVYVRVDELVAVLGRLDGMLPCLSDVLPREQLARIFYLEGVGLSYQGNPDGAREAFRHALVVSPEFAWDARFPPDARALFDEAVAAATEASAATVTIGRLADDGVSLWIDGEPFPAGGGTASLAAGGHLLQWRSVRGGFGTWFVRVEGGGELACLGRGDVARAAVSGQGHDAALQIAAGLLAAQAQMWEVDVLHLVELGERDLLHRFDPATRAWSITDHGRVERLQRRRTLRRAGAACLIAGGAVAAVGAVLAATGHRQAVAIRDDVPSLTSDAQFESSHEQYRAARGRAYAGYSLAGLGGAALVSGIPLAVAGTRRDDRRAALLRARSEVELDRVRAAGVLVPAVDDE